MAQRPGEQGPRREARVPQGVPESSGAGGRKRTANLNRPRKPEVDSEGNSFRIARKNETKKREPFGWRSPNAHNWLSFSDRYQRFVLIPMRTHRGQRQC